tara:strand:- start:7006 stop:8148 length:1143 start_codon:yes stop_codon:yes gene_type:complete
MDTDLATEVRMLESHIDGMIARVQRNEDMLKRFHDLEMQLLSLNSLKELVENILDDAKSAFNLQSLSLVLADGSGDISTFLAEDGFCLQDAPSVVLTPSVGLFKAKLGLSQRVLLGDAATVLVPEFWPAEQKRPASVALIPLIRRGVHLGCLVFGSDDKSRFEANMSSYLLDRLGKVLSVCMENTLNYEQLRRSSLFDTLTGVNNRRFFEQRIEEEMLRSLRTGDDLSCLFIDIDFFKKVNDTYGHQVGDTALRHVAECLRSQLRSNDILARYGGEEFVAILPTAAEQKGTEVAERMRKLVERSILPITDNEQLELTVSIGVSTFVVEQAGSSSSVEKTDLIEVADKALYQAKHSGRNKVVSGGVVLSGLSAKTKSSASI